MEYLYPKPSHSTQYLNQRESIGSFVVLIVTVLVILAKCAFISLGVSTAEERSIVIFIAQHQFVAQIVEDLIAPVHLSVQHSEKFLEREELVLLYRKDSNYMTIMKFLLLNAESFNTAKYDVLDIVNKYDIDFLCLNETWEEKKKPISFQIWKTLSKPRHNGIHGGVAIFINPKKSTCITEATNDFNDENLECVSIKIKTNLNVEVNLVVAYEPPNKNDQLKTLVSKVQKLGKKNIVLLGDLNAKSKECHNSVANTAGSVVEDLMTTCNLVCYNDGQPTRRDSNSVVDLVLCSAELSKYSQVVQL